MSFDLHTHSTCSDGSYAPEDLIDLAIAEGLQGISITDHDSVNAYPGVIISAKQKGIQILPGVEFSTHFNGKSVHILGYSFDFTHPAILDLCIRHEKRREDRNRKILDKLKQEGIIILEDDLRKTALGVIGRPHIAQLLVKGNYAKNIAHAFKIYLGDGKRCFVPGYSLSVDESIDAIHQAKGYAILAHPHLFNSRSFAKKLIEAFPFDGIESVYSLMTSSQNAFWIEYANKHHLLKTGGSDFHGAAKPDLKLGAAKVEWEYAELLFSQFYSNFSEYRP